MGEHEDRARADDRKKVAKHAKWLADEPGGERASWMGDYIDGDVLRGKDLRRADFRGVNIHNADMSFANLQGADFSPIIYPNGESPYPTQIRNSLFIGANLEGANLSGGMQALRVSFPEANLRDADLRDSGFSHADFAGADLRGAKLRNTGFVNADLHQARVDDGQLDPARIKQSRLPDGSMHAGALLKPFKVHGNKFELWHADDLYAASNNGRVLGKPEQLFPRDYRQVATAEAETLDQVVALANQADPGIPGIRWMGSPNRPTADGDVIVASDGSAYRVEAYGFNAIESTPFSTQRGRLEAGAKTAKEPGSASDPAHRAQYQQRDPDRGHDR
jgi:hypothetical protein